MILEKSKEMWTETPRLASGKKGKPVNKDRFGICMIGTSILPHCYIVTNEIPKCRAMSASSP